MGHLLRLLESSPKSILLLILRFHFHLCLRLLPRKSWLTTTCWKHLPSQFYFLFCVFICVFISACGFTCFHERVGCSPPSWLLESFPKSILLCLQNPSWVPSRSSSVAKGDHHLLPNPDAPGFPLPSQFYFLFLVFIFDASVACVCHTHYFVYRVASAKSYGCKPRQSSSFSRFQRTPFPSCNSIELHATRPHAETNSFRQPLYPNPFFQQDPFSGFDSFVPVHTSPRPPLRLTRPTTIPHPPQNFRHRFHGRQDRPTSSASLASDLPSAIAGSGSASGRILALTFSPLSSMAEGVRCFLPNRDGPGSPSQVNFTFYFGGACCP